MPNQKKHGAPWKPDKGKVAKPFPKPNRPYESSPGKKDQREKEKKEGKDK